MGTFETTEKIVRRNAIFSYFDYKTAIKSFLVGTFNNYMDKNNILSRYDDIENNNIFQKGCKITNIQFFFVDNRIIGYHLTYIDILNKPSTIKRLAHNYKYYKIDNKKDFILKVNEHLIDIIITFNHEYITSVNLKTDIDNSIEYGKLSSSTSVSKLDPSSAELNVIFGFETGFSELGLKEIFIYRGAIIKRKKSATVISAEKYHKLVLKNNNDNFLDVSPSKVNDKKTTEFKDLMIKRLNEIQNSNNNENEDKSLHFSHTKTENDEIWNEEKLADQEQVHCEEEDKEEKKPKRRKSSLVGGGSPNSLKFPFKSPFENKPKNDGNN